MAFTLGRPGWLGWKEAIRRYSPPLLLALALSSLFVGRDIHTHGYFYSSAGDNNWDSVKNLWLAENLSPDHRWRLFLSLYPNPDGDPGYVMYSRFPLGGYALIKLAIAPFEDPLAQIFAARLLMLALFGAAAALAYAALCRIAKDRWIALAATVFAFYSRRMLEYGDAITTEGVIDLFAVMLVFHGMVLYVQSGRFGQLLAKTCAALFLGWHVYALLLAFAGIGFCACLLDRRRRGASAARQSPPLEDSERMVGISASHLLALATAAFFFGAAVLAFNLANEFAAHQGKIPWRDLHSVRSMLSRTGLVGPVVVEDAGSWSHFARQQIAYLGRMFIPSFVNLPSGWRHAMIAIGALAAAGCLFGLLLAPSRLVSPKAKTLLGTLALSGPCWALPMRNNTSFHQLESIFYVGVPLTAMTLCLLVGAKLSPRLSRAAAAIALPLFIVSSVAHNARPGREDLIAQQRAALAELDHIRQATQGGTVCLVSSQYGHAGVAARRRGNERIAILARLSLPSCEWHGKSAKERSGGDRDFIVSLLRPAHQGAEERRLLTPHNQFMFLYDSSAFDTVADFHVWLYRLHFAEIAADGPVAREAFDVYWYEDVLVFVREPCSIDDLAAKFFLHVVPRHSTFRDSNRRNVDRQDVDRQDVDRQRADFINLDFSAFGRWSHPVFFDDKCLVYSPSLVYGPLVRNRRVASGATGRTGQYVDGADRKEIWQVSFEFGNDRDEEAPLAAP